MKAQNSIDSSSIGTDKQDPLRIFIFGDISVKIDNLLPIYDSDNKITLRNIDILQKIAQDFDVIELIKANERLIYLDCPDSNKYNSGNIIDYIINKINQEKPDFLNHKGEQVEVVLYAHGGISDNEHQIKLNGHRHNTLQLISSLQAALGENSLHASKFLLLSYCSGQISTNMEQADAAALPLAETVVITQNKKDNNELAYRFFFMLLDLLRFVGKYSLINAIFNALNYDHLEDLNPQDFKNEFSISQFGKDGFKRI